MRVACVGVAMILACVAPVIAFVMYLFLRFCCRDRPRLALSGQYSSRDVLRVRHTPVEASTFRKALDVFIERMH